MSKHEIYYLRREIPQGGPLWQLTPASRLPTDLYIYSASEHAEPRAEVIPITRSKIVAATGDKPSIVSLTLPTSASCFDYFSPGQPNPVFIKLYIATREVVGPLYPALVLPAVKYIWSGAFEGVSVADKTMTLTFSSPLTTALRTRTPDFYFQRSCNHDLYGPHCGADITENTVDASIASITGNGAVVTVSASSLTAAQQVTGYFNGGTLIHIDSSQSRTIKSHDGVNFQLDYPLPSTTTRGCRVTRGCNHQPTDCKEKFDNLSNFGGFALVPTKGSKTEEAGNIDYYRQDIGTSSIDAITNVDDPRTPEGRKALVVQKNDPPKLEGL